MGEPRGVARRDPVLVVLDDGAAAPGGARVVGIVATIDLESAHCLLQRGDKEAWRAGAKSKYTSRKEMTNCSPALTNR